MKRPHYCPFDSRKLRLLVIHLSCQHGSVPPAATHQPAPAKTRAALRQGPATSEMNRIRLDLFDMKNRIFGPPLANIWDLFGK
jgi:hypothetical protein